MIGNLHRRYNETNSDYMREKISEVMSERVCPVCNGARLRKEAMAVTINGANIVEVTYWPVTDYSGMGAAPVRPGNAA